MNTNQRAPNKHNINHAFNEPFCTLASVCDRTKPQLPIRFYMMLQWLPFVLLPDIFM